MADDTGTRTVSLGAQDLEGFLGLPAAARGLVVFAHGAGSSRFSARNRFVANRLEASRLATLLFDLLSEEEATDRANVFDIPLLAGRMVEALDWVATRDDLKDLPVGLFGSSTGAAAALVAAAQAPERVSAVVSRGGRPDLAGSALSKVECPTLLIVGGADYQVLELNREALDRLSCEKRLDVVPGATHLFEEPGTLEQVAELAASWFTGHLGSD
ncbi:MAG TPA: alpha/beta fold hydrolase [Afifellaceae bacterium]|nr:alpha/beta fold hydrolase [Afifellaceae bacterium]